MKINAPMDHLEEISGIGTVKDQIFQESQQRHFTVYGSLQNVLTQQNISEISSGGAALIDMAMKGTPLSQWADFAGTLCKAVLEMGLSGIKKWSNNRDIRLACEYILKLFSYCKEDLFKEYSYAENVFIESVVSGLPLSKHSAKNIFIYSQIENLSELPKRVVFDDMSYRNIGYQIFYLYQIAGVNIETSRRVNEAYAMLGIDKEDIKQFHIDYREDREEKVRFGSCMQQIFENVDYERFDLNPRYVKGVLRKLKSAYPDGKPGKNVIGGLDLLTDFYFERNGQAASNILAGILQVIGDGSGRKIDDINEEYIKNMRGCYGADVVNYDNEIIKGAKDYKNVMES